MTVSVATGNEIPGYPEIPGRGYPARTRFFEICQYPDLARTRVLRGRGTGEAGEARASPEFRGFTTEKFLASSQLLAARSAAPAGSITRRVPG